jgi:hypothetical protein
MVIETSKAGPIETFRKLPRGAQLLIAYFLYNKLWELQLLEKDPDAQALVAIGWLVAKRRGVEKITGCKTYEFSEAGADGIDSIRDEILASVIGEEMEHYKRRKDKLYPWLW